MSQLGLVQVARETQDEVPEAFALLEAQCFPDAQHLFDDNWALSGWHGEAQSGVGPVPARQLRLLISGHYLSLAHPGHLLNGLLVIAQLVQDGFEFSAYRIGAHAGLLGEERSEYVRLPAAFEDGGFGQKNQIPPLAV